MNQQAKIRPNVSLNSSMKWKLTSRKFNKSHRLRDGLNLLGRAKNNDIILNGTLPMHAVIYVRRRILELDAKGPVYLNGIRVNRPTTMFYGDCISLRTKNQKQSFYIDFDKTEDLMTKQSEKETNNNKSNDVTMENQRNRDELSCSEPEIMEYIDLTEEYFI